MKILIWILCLSVPAIIKTILDSNGIVLGAIPTVILWAPALWLARHFCKKLDEDSAKKDRAEYNAKLGRIAQCKYCGYRDKEVYNYCPKCGKSGMEYTYNHSKETLKYAVELAIAGRTSLSNQTSPNWENEIKQCWNTEIDILSANIENSIFFFQHDCTVEDLYWLSEIFDILIEKTQSQNLLIAIQERFQNVDEETFSQENFQSEYMRDYVGYNEYCLNISKQIKNAMSKLNN